MVLSHKNSLQSSNAALVGLRPDSQLGQVEYRPVGHRSEGVCLPLAISVRHNVRLVAGELRDIGAGRLASARSRSRCRVAAGSRSRCGVTAGGG